MRHLPLLFALLGALLTGTHGSAQSPTSGASLATSLRAALDSRAIGHARVTMMVASADSSLVYFAVDENRAMNPASNAKLLTTAAALSLLGPATSFTTTLGGARSGELVEGLSLRGGGDPSLRARDLDALACELASQGVRRVTGGVLLDDSLYNGETLPPGFEQQPGEDAGYRPAVSALAIDDAAVTLNFRGDQPGTSCNAFASPPEAVSLVNRARVGANPGLNFSMFAIESGMAQVTVTGQCAVGISSFRRRQLHPTLVAGEVLRRALARYGVTVEGASRSGGAPPATPSLAVHRSAQLSILVQEAGKQSNNFTAEMLLLAVGGPGTDAASRGARRVLEWARSRGVSTEGMVLRNGSGLYDVDRLSARQLIEVLRVVWRDRLIRHEFVAHLASSGVDGTLAHRLESPRTHGIIRAKTGTLDDVIALSGYILSPNSRGTIAFSILVNDTRGHNSEARHLVDALALAIARWAHAGRP